MTADRQVTATLAAWIARQAATPLPPDIKHHVQRMALDYFGGVVAAAHGEVGGVVGEHLHRHYGNGPATALGQGKTTALGAALLNGTNAHGVETDDGYTPGSYHPGCVTFPAVFAAAEAENTDAETILRAAAIGLEVGCRIAASGHPATRRRGFHNTAIAGVFAAAASAAVIQGLNENQIANALGIAGSHSSGLFAFLKQSAEVKRLHAGKSARDGLAAADLAACGLTGPTTILEGEDGYFGAFAGNEGTDWFASTVVNGLGEDWVVLHSYIKPYPCCRHLHGAIDAVIDLRREYDLTPERVKTIRIGTFGIAVGHGGRDVSTMMGAQLSMPFAVAVALTRGRVTLTDFSVEARSDQAVLGLMDRVEITLHEKAESDYPKRGRPAYVTLVLDDGTEVFAHVQQPYGEPTNPMSDADLEQKVRALTTPIIGDEGADLLVKSAWNFTDLNFLTRLDELLHACPAT